MRALLQRVLSAQVRVSGETVGQIGPGLLVFLGVGKEDSPEDRAWLVEKVAGLRVFEDEAGKMNRSVLEGPRAALVVSQFTLYADTRKGRRPSFTDAAPPEAAKAAYEAFCSQLAAQGLSVERGVFAADMKVSLVNDGPVTLWLDSRDR